MLHPFLMIIIVVPMLKIFLILILMMMLVWILFQYWNQLVCNTLFTSKIIRKCFLKLVHTWCRVYTMLKTILIFLTLLQFLELRMNPLYSIYFNWFRFIVIGIIPFALLVSYFFLISPSENLFHEKFI